MKPLWKTVWSLFKKLKIELPYDLAIPCLGIYLGKTIIQKDTCNPMFIAALFPNWGVINIVLHGYKDWDFVSSFLRKEWKCLVQRIAACCKVKTSLVHCAKVWTCVTGCIEKPNVQRVLFQVFGYLAQLSLSSVCLCVCASCILPSFVYPLVAKPLLVVNNYSIKLSGQTLTDIRM